MFILSIDTPNPTLIDASLKAATVVGGGVLAVQVSLSLSLSRSLRFKDIFIYIGGVLRNLEWCIG